MSVFANWRVSVYGLLSWLVPFAVSIPFFDPQQGLIVPLVLFKSLMVVIGTLAGVVLLLLVFRSAAPHFRTGLVVGLYWLALNWVLDILVLVPMSGGDIGTWFLDIGLRYLSIPIIAAGMGWLADHLAHA